MVQAPKQSISIGAYGWRHKHWLTSFYPDDLPEDWQLTFYSNEFNAVMVPSVYWSEHSIVNTIVDCEQWLDSVHDNFDFYVQCQAEMFDVLPAEEILDQLKILRPQLAALVFDGDERELHDDIKTQIIALAESLEVELIGINLDAGGSAVWREIDDSPLQPGLQPSAQQRCSKLACIENELTDMRMVRIMFERFASQFISRDTEQGSGACIIVNHPLLQARNISSARAVLEIMGY